MNIVLGHLFGLRVDFFRMGVTIAFFSKLGKTPDHTDIFTM